jgi:hypothetical protein
MHTHKLLYSFISIDGLRTETRVGVYIDTNKNYKVVYECAFVGKLNNKR